MRIMERTFPTIAVRKLSNWKFFSFQSSSEAISFKNISFPSLYLLLKNTNLSLNNSTRLRLCWLRESKRLRTNEKRRIEESRVSDRASQNGTLSRVNRANEAVWLRQGRRLYFSLTHRALVRLSVHPSVRERLRGFSLSFSRAVQPHEDEEGGQRGGA